MANSIFFSQNGTKNSQFAADCQSENLKRKNLNVQCTISKRQDLRVIVNKSLNKMLICV